jgi:hypothetical protein
MNNLTNPDRLARFRADPTKVRVSIRGRKRNWTATVQSLIDPFKIASVMKTSPRKAVMLALREAESLGMEGVDLGMGSAYVHPFR